MNPVNDIDPPVVVNYEHARDSKTNYVANVVYKNVKGSVNTATGDNFNNVLQNIDFDTQVSVAKKQKKLRSKDLPPVITLKNKVQMTLAIKARRPTRAKTWLMKPMI